MLWPICVLSSCICRTLGEVDRKVSRSTTSRFVMSVRLGVMFGMWAWGVWYIAE